MFRPEMRKLLALLHGYTLTPHEAATARHGFTAFAYVLASYFILLPLREDVALTLGPAVLPRLFAASLLLTALVAPAVTAYVVNPTAGSRAVGFRRLCRLLASCLLVLFVLLLATSPDPWVGTRLLRLPRLLLAKPTGSSSSSSLPPLSAAAATAAAPRAMGTVSVSSPVRLSQRYATAPETAAGQSQALRRQQQQSPLVLPAIGTAGEVDKGEQQQEVAEEVNKEEQQQQEQEVKEEEEARRRQLSMAAVVAGRDTGRGQGQEAASSWYGNAVRVCFYVYLSLQSLLSTSALWSVCADCFSPAAGTRLYGVLGAGATFGQLLASAAALAFGEACSRTGAAGASVWLLLPAAGLLLRAAGACQAMVVAGAQDPQLHPLPLHPHHHHQQGHQQQEQERGSGSGGKGGGEGYGCAQQHPGNLVRAIAMCATLETGSPHAGIHGDSANTISHHHHHQQQQQQQQHTYYPAAGLRPPLLHRRRSSDDDCGSGGGGGGTNPGVLLSSDPSPSYPEDPRHHPRHPLHPQPSGWLRRLSGRLRRATSTSSSPSPSTKPLSASSSSSYHLHHYHPLPASSSHSSFPASSSLASLTSPLTSHAACLTSHAASHAASHAGRLAEGFRLIGRSPYLLSAAAFLSLHYAVSATLYFLRASILAADPELGPGPGGGGGSSGGGGGGGGGGGSASEARIAFIAGLNTASAGLIFAAQVSVTGRALTRLGVAPTLLAGPAVSLLGLAAVAAAPHTATIAVVELVRKVVGYSLARPSREVLFTLVSRREKYGAKLVLDTVVQRAGDAAAAALFQIVGVQLSRGPSAVAAVGLVLCVVHLGVAAALGRMYGNRKKAAAAAAADAAAASDATAGDGGNGSGSGEGKPPHQGLHVL